MSTALIVAIVVGIILVICLWRAQRSKELVNAGKIINRKGYYWEEEEIFELDAPYEDVLAAVRNTDYSDCSVDIQYNYGGSKIIFFKSSHAWNAALVYKGFSGTKHVYRLSFPAWKTRNGSPYDVVSMNVLLTQTEKMLLSLDPETTVETHRVQLNTKTNFI